jgi:WD40 repeat protein
MTGHSSWVQSVAFSRDGTRIVSGSEDRLVKIWDTKTGALVSSFVKVP